MFAKFKILEYELSSVMKLCPKFEILEYELSSIMKLCAKFELNQIVRHMISIKKAKAHFDPGPCLI